MRFLAPMIVITALLLQFASPSAAMLLQFASPSGEPIFINTEQLVAVVEPAGCDPRSNARILTTTGPLCVKDTIAQVLAKYLVETPK